MMQVLDGIESLGGAHQAKNLLKSGSIVTIGNFDGVHLGHQTLIKRAREIAQGRPVVVFTFDPHPLTVLRPGLKVRQLFGLKDRIHQLEGMGVDLVVVQRFTKGFSCVSAEKFLLDFILQPLAAKALVVGYDFNFGTNRQGTIDFLKEKSSQYGAESPYHFRLEVVEPLLIDYLGNRIPVSSSKIRGFLQSGDVEAAKAFLGRAFSIRGEVVHGKARGRTIGFPTANIRSEVEPVIKIGVYAGYAMMPDGELRKTAISVGHNPTFEDQEKTVHIEAYILPDHSKGVGDLYGKILGIEFQRKIREELKFSSVDELIQEIKKDVDFVRINLK